MKVLLSLSLLCLLVEVLTNYAHQTYRLHYRGAALCNTYTTRKASVDSVITCASLALSVNAPAFAYCKGEAADCILATSNYTVGTWASSAPSCLLYSSSPPLPPPPPPPQGTKIFVLSRGSTVFGDLTSLSTNDLCAADGLQFAVVATPAELQLLLDQVGA
ncbi:uncharacterized protein LOC125178707, partial [Hyalella azteca]|uniref:Uncharacterized protein LOC125178707 n=1 Tax=Hyalella azteca TaxID=294128 RepID=A0A979FSB6_HYAAZ